MASQEMLTALSSRAGGAPKPAAQPTSGSGDAMVDVLRPIDENSLLWLSQQPVGRMPPGPVEEVRPYRQSPFQRIGNFAQDAMQGAGMDRYAAHTLRGQLFGAQGDKGRGIGVADFVPGLDTSAAADDYRANPGLLTGAGVGLSMLPLVGGFAAKGIGRLGRGLLDDVPTSMFDVDPTMPAKLVNPEMRVFQGGPNLYGPDVPGTKAGLDSSKIGTGEGAQVYGHGHYLAENPDVALGYKTSTSYADIKRKFLSELPQDADFDEAIDLAESGAFGASGKRFIEALAADDWLGFDYPSQAISAALGKNIDNWDPSAVLTKARENLGHLYEYDLPDETIAKMLDWDAPYDKQPENVRASIRKLWLDKGGDPSVARPWAAHSEADGESIRAAIESSYGPGGSQEALREAGIPGIRYLDQGSRAGGGTSNFVLFDDDAAKLLARDDTRFALPTDEASRMARAREMGFDVDPPLFHGTSDDITEFVIKKGSTGEFGPAVYLTTSPAEAAAYAGTHPGSQNVMPVMARLKNPMRVGSPDEFWQKFGAGTDDAGAVSAAKKAGHDGVIIERPVRQWDEASRSIIDTGETSQHYIVFDPSQVRSRFAQFDPAKKDSADILAGLAGLGVLGAGAAALPQDDSDMVSALRGM